MAFLFFRRDLQASVGKLAMRFWYGEEASTISASHTTADAPIIAESVVVTHVEDAVAKVDEDKDEVRSRGCTLVKAG